MIKTLSLVAILTTASVSVVTAAPAGGLHRGSPPAAAPGGGLHRSGVGGAAILNKNFGGAHGLRRDGRFFGSPWFGVAPYDAPPADVSVSNDQFIVQAPPARRVCRTQAVVVPREAGGEREVTVTRCFLE